MSKKRRRRRRSHQILCFKGICNYDHLRLFVHYMAQAFEGEGVGVQIYDLAGGAPSASQWAEIRESKPSLSFSFNLLGAGHTNASGWAPPLSTWMVDEPYYRPQWAPVLQRPEIRTFWAADFTRDQARALGLNNASTLELAGRALPVCRPADRTIDVLFAGSAADPEKMRSGWKRRLGPSASRLMRALAEEWGADPTRSLAKTLDGVCRTFGLEGHPAIAQARPVFFAEANRYVRIRGRLDVLRTLRDMPGVVVFGDGWRELLPKARFDFRPSVPFSLFEEAVNSSKVTLAVQPIHGLGPSERYFTSMANNSALVVNHNSWLSEHYVEGGEYRSFAMGDPRDARGHLERLLTDEKARLEQVEKARARTLAQHTWTHRARALLDAHGIRDAKAA